MIINSSNRNNLRHPHLWALLAAVALTGCTHNALGLKMESRAFATQLGFPHCDVYAPLSQEDLLASARRIGIENLEASSEWANVVATAIPNDQLRLINCPNSRRVRGSRGGYSFYGLFQRDRLVLESGQVIND
ncbi:hypothetical protein ACYX7E_18815 [Luteimonas sp. RIT-PG2_3]